MQKLVWQNANGDSIDLTSGNYGITQWEGFSNTSLNIQNQQVPFQDGAVFLDALIEPRELSVTLKMQDNGNLEERYRMRRELIHALNPKLGEGYLIYTNDFISKRIKCVAQVPLFETHNSDTVGTPKASLAWTACEPYWEDLEETEVTFKQVQKVVNNGDIPCQIKARYKTGTENPLLYNKTNNKKIALNGTFNNSIIIDTEKGTKSANLEKFNLKWVNGGRFRASCNGQNKNVYVGEICLAEDCLTGEIYNTNLASASYNFNCVTFSEDLDLFIIGSGNGQFYISNDAFDWYVINSGVNTSINEIIYKNEQFIAVGNNGIILSSFDGNLWTQQNSGVSSSLNGITYGNGMFVISGDNGTILTSTDGITWTSRYNDTTKPFQGITFSKLLGLFITIYNNECLTSVDGITWISKNITSSSSIVFYSIDCSEKLIIAVGNRGAIFTSTDTVNWTQIDVGITYYLYNIYYSNKYTQFLIAGSNGTILSSYDGVEWGFLSSGGGENYYSITFSEYLKLFVAVGTNGSIITSQNGKDWTRRTSGVSTVLQNVIYSETLKKFYIVGNNGIILTSVDGMSWTSISSGITNNLRCIIYNENLFVIVGEGGTILTSSNGMSWTSISSGTSENLFGVAFGKNLFIAVGNDGTILTSSNGTSWTSRTSGTNRQLFGVMYEHNNDIYIITGGHGTILVSNDGINWSNRYIGAEVFIRNPIYIDSIGIFLAIGSYLLVITSINGIDWNIESVSDYNLNFWSVVYSEELEKFVIVGNNGIIYNSISVKENIISSLTSQSDMSFNLEVGENDLTFITENNAECTLSYRQKYIGV